MRVWNALVLSCLGASVLPGQVQPRQDNPYIEKTFATLIGEEPPMGWFVPDLGFVAQQDSESVSILGSLGRLNVGLRNRPLSGKEVLDIRKWHWLACEMAEKDLLTAYHVGDGETERGRALYTSKKLLGNLRAGLVSIPLDSGALAKVNARLGWPSRGVLRRDEALAVDSQSAWYSLHKLWDAKSGKLSRQAIVLHDRNGRILALNAERDLEQGPGCDGCWSPTYWSRGQGEDTVLNMFDLPGFAYPVLLLDTSTIEGQALSLVTFTPGLEMAQFRVYEYVMHCRDY